MKTDKYKNILKLLGHLGGPEPLRSCLRLSFNLFFCFISGIHLRFQACSQNIRENPETIKKFNDTRSQKKRGFLPKPLTPEWKHEQSRRRLSHIQLTAVPQFYTFQILDNKDIIPASSLKYKQNTRTLSIYDKILTYNADHRNLYKKEHRHSK